MAFINKQWQRNASANAVNALLRVGGATASAATLKYIADKATGSGLKKTIGNIAAPALTAMGVLVDLIAANDNVRAFAQGIYTMGMLRTITTIADVAKRPLGLSGFDGEIMNGAEIMNGSEEIVYVDENGNVISGIGATDETSTADLPEEIADAQINADPNGRTFTEVADYIEQGADSAIEVNGAIGNFGDVDETDIDIAESMM